MAAKYVFDSNIFIGLQQRQPRDVYPSVWNKIDELMEDEGFDAVFVGSGAGLPNFMNIPGESYKGVYSANEFLTRSNLMKAYREDPETPIMKGGKVAVVGGGNVAMDAARTALRLGAEVHIVYRRSEAELPARAEEVHHAKEEGVIFDLLCNPVEILVDENDAVAGMKYYGAPLIMIDMGTATTVTVVDSKRNCTGGLIIPGVKISLDSLTGRTSQLPKISLDAPKKVVGTNTIDSMKSGIIYGTAGSIDGGIDRIEEELGEKITTVATGGLAELIIPYCRHKIILDNELLLKGLMIIYNKNK